MNITDLQALIRVPYFDYQKLKSVLQNDSHERRTISNWVKKDYLTRVKKGLYTWGPKTSPAFHYSPVVLANLIFGPSYVSLEYALSYHNLIPERVVTVTSVTMKRKKTFETPLGLFTYEYLNSEAFPWGQILVYEHRSITAMMATPEKALLDYIALRVKSLISGNNFEEFLYSDLRIDEEDFEKLDHSKLLELGAFYRNTNIKNFLHFLRLRGSNG